MTTESLRLIIVDDEEAHVEAIRRAFAAVGSTATIHVAHTLREYSEIAADQPLDLALVDLNLPDGRAVDVLTSPPEDGPFPILVMTAFGNQQIVVEVMKAGALDYVVKSPEAFAVMPRTVERMRRHWELLQSQKDAEKALRNSERRFRGFVENISDIVYELTPEGVFQYVSPNWLELIGEPAANVIGKSFEPYIHPDDIRSCREFLERAYGSRERLTSMDYRVVRPDGAVRWHCSNGVALRDSDGSVIGFLGVSRDITERKQAERALQEARDFLNEVGKISKIGGWRMDLSTRKATWTLGTYDIVEIAPGQPIPGPDEHVDYYLPEYRSLVAEAIRALIEDGKPLDFEARLRTAKGNVKWCRAVGRAIHKDGKAVEIYGTFQDITERKQAEESLAEETIRRRILIDESNDGIMILDTDGKVVEANRRSAEMLGYSPDEMRQLHIWDWDTEWTREKTLEMIGSLDETGARFETRHRRKDGTVYDAEISTNAAICNGRKLIFCVCRDITERKRAEEIIQDSKTLYSSLVENLPQNVFRKDREGRFLFCNQRFCENAGHSLEEIVGKTDADLFPLELAEAYRQDDLRVMESGQILDRVEENMGADGRKSFVQVVKTPLRDAAGAVIGMQGIFWDITERMKAADALRQQTEELRARNEELERFNNASVGRELRMIELKREINQLCQQSGLPPRYAQNSATESKKTGNHTPPTKPGQP